MVLYDELGALLAQKPSDVNGLGWPHDLIGNKEGNPKYTPDFHLSNKFFRSPPLASEANVSYQKQNLPSQIDSSPKDISRTYFTKSPDHSFPTPKSSPSFSYEVQNYSQADLESITSIRNDLASHDPQVNFTQTIERKEAEWYIPDPKSETPQKERNQEEQLKLNQIQWQVVKQQELQQQLQKEQTLRESEQQEDIIPILKDLLLQSNTMDKTMDTTPPPDSSPNHNPKQTQISPQTNPQMQHSRENKVTNSQKNGSNCTDVQTPASHDSRSNSTGSVQNNQVRPGSGICNDSAYNKPASSLDIRGLPQDYSQNHLESLENQQTLGQFAVTHRVSLETPQFSSKRRRGRPRGSKNGVKTPRKPRKSKTVSEQDRQGRLPPPYPGSHQQFSGYTQQSGYVQSSPYSQPSRHAQQSGHVQQSRPTQQFGYTQQSGHVRQCGYSQQPGCSNQPSYSQQLPGNFQPRYLQQLVGSSNQLPGYPQTSGYPQHISGYTQQLPRVDHTQNAHSALQNMQQQPQHMQQLPPHLQQLSQCGQQLPQRMQPLPQNMQQLPQNMQQLPQSMQRLPHYIQQLPQHMQQLPQSMQQLPQSLQQLPQSMPQLPQSMPQLPQSMPQLPQSMPQLPQSMQQKPESMQPFTVSLQTVTEYAHQQLQQQIQPADPQLYQEILKCILRKYGENISAHGLQYTNQQLCSQKNQHVGLQQQLPTMSQMSFQASQSLGRGQQVSQQKEIPLQVQQIPSQSREIPSEQYPSLSEQYPSPSEHNPSPSEHYPSPSEYYPSPPEYRPSPLNRISEPMSTQIHSSDQREHFTENSPQFPPPNTPKVSNEEPTPTPSTSSRSWHIPEDQLPISEGNRDLPECDNCEVIDLTESSPNAEGQMLESATPGPSFLEKEIALNWTCSMPIEEAVRMLHFEEELQNDGSIERQELQVVSRNQQTNELRETSQLEVKKEFTNQEAPSNMEIENKTYVETREWLAQSPPRLVIDFPEEFENRVHSRLMRWYYKPHKSFKASINRYRARGIPTRSPPRKSYFEYQGSNINRVVNNINHKSSLNNQVAENPAMQEGVEDSVLSREESASSLQTTADQDSGESTRTAIHHHSIYNRFQNFGRLLHKSYRHKRKLETKSPKKS